MSYPDLTNGELIATLVCAYFFLAVAIIAAASIKGALSKHRECDCNSHHSEQIKKPKA
jgi:hypothetical protein